MAYEAAGIDIRRWETLDERAALLPEIERIFFEASATKSFASERERAAFRERWLGRFLDHYPATFYVAVDRGRAVTGYLAGGVDDPARNPLFADCGYFASFAELTAAYPAQFHINLAPSWRGLGIGGRLIEAFVADLRAIAVPGVHVVTARGMRNVGFYLANGFAEAGSLSLGDGRELLFLGRRVAG